MTWERFKKREYLNIQIIDGDLYVFVSDGTVPKNEPYHPIVLSREGVDNECLIGAIGESEMWVRYPL